MAEDNEKSDGEAVGRTPRKRVRASIACAACSQRKTKCDVSQTGQPCTKCRDHSRDCQLLETKRGKYNRAHMYKRSSTAPQNLPPDPANQINQSTSPNNQQTRSSSSTAVTNSTGEQTHPTSRPRSSDTFGALLQNVQSATATSASNGPASTFQLPPMPSASPTYQTASISIPLASTTFQPHLVPGSSAQGPYLGQGGSVQWSPASGQAGLSIPDEQNYTFDFGQSSHSLVPATSTFTASASSTNRLQSLPNVQSAEQAEQTDDTNEWTDLMAIPVERLEEAHDSQNVMYAGSLFTLSHLLRQHWNSQDNTKVSQDRLHFPGGIPETSKVSQIAQQQHHLQLQFLSQIGCFTLPPKQVLDRMISAYFNYFHPMYPVLSRARFYQQYETVMSGGVPMLLLWGMLYVSCTLCNLEDLEMAGFHSRFEALRSFCIRGKALYNGSYERDKVNIVIFEFLLSQIWSDGEDSYIWSGRAATTAQSMGMHRTTANSKLVDEDKRLWRRVWWAVFIRDRHAAAATGRPYRIHEDFNDIELPQREDFDTEEIFLRFFYSVKLAKLVSKVVECKMIVNMEYDIIQRAACYQGFTEWMNNLPNQLSASHAPTDIFTAFLHLSYHCWVIHLFRPGAEEEESSPIASQSAAAATRLFEDLLQQGRVGQGPQFTVTCLFAAMAQHVADCRTSTGTIRTLCTHRLAVCRLAAKELAAMRPVAAWFKRMFHSLDTRTPEEQEASKKNIDQSLANLLNIPQDSAFTNHTQPLGATGTGEPSALFADFLWDMPTQYIDDAPIDWLLDNY